MLHFDTGTEKMATEVRVVLPSLVFIATLLLIDNAVCLLGRTTLTAQRGSTAHFWVAVPQGHNRAALPSKQTVLSITSDVANKTKLVSTALTLVAIFSVPGASGTTRL